MTDPTDTESPTPVSDDPGETRTRTRTRNRRSRSADDESTSPAGEVAAAEPGGEPEPSPAPKRRTTRKKTAAEPPVVQEESRASAEANDAPSGEGDADDGDVVVRRRRRRRVDEPEGGDDDSPPDADAAPADEAADEAKPAKATRPRKSTTAKRTKSTRTDGDEPETDAATAETDTPDTAADAETGADTGGEDDSSESTTAGDGHTPEGEGTRRRSSRRRGGRGRGRRGGRGRSSGEVPDEGGGGADADQAGEAPADAADEAGPAPTRLQARSRSARGNRSGTRSGRTRSGSSARSRRPIGGVSEETRRAITEGPPRRMMVSVGQERTQIAVLEERTLVEHYVTRREDVSYVGNIYLGRVQNVLPGMEAAFVDIGKGRNGVLYAGEVNYDEADLETDLPRIEQHLKSGQAVLVQVTKDPMGTKGARLTQHLSIAGRYCVLAPGDGMLGISRKLTDDERERLRKILKAIKPDGYGLIVRTAAEGATREQLEADVARLVRIWEQVNERAEKAKVLEPVYEEPDLVMRVIRDVFGTEYSELVVDNNDLAEKVRDYLSDVSPELTEHIKVHEGDDHIFDAYEITNQIRRALEKKVWLKSGGYLIVEKTEAMWVIDVNTGKFVGERNLEETVLKNNIEAAVEIARQLRLRDMGGIIVIDFVDMLVPANRDEVLKRFRRELARDKTKSRVMEISKLGLVQMTRKNVSQGLQESFTTKCDVCEGRGATIAESIV